MVASASRRVISHLVSVCVWLWVTSEYFQLHVASDENELVILQCVRKVFKVFGDWYYFWARRVEMTYLAARL